MERKGILWHPKQVKHLPTRHQISKVKAPAFYSHGPLAVLTMHHVSTLSQKEGTVLLLADILCACYGWEAVPGVREPPPAAPQPARVDPSYVNNPSLADVTFR